MYLLLFEIDSDDEGEDENATTQNDPVQSEIPDVCEGPLFEFLFRHGSRKDFYSNDGACEKVRFAPCLEYAVTTSSRDAYLTHVFKFSAEAWRWYHGSKFSQVSPLEMFDTLQVTLRCKCGKKLVHHGWLKGFRQVKSLSGSVEFVQMRQYICNECPLAAAEGKQSRTYGALSQHIQDQLPDFASRIDLVNTDRGSTLREDLILAREASQRRCRYESLVTAAKVARSETTVMKELARIAFHVRSWAVPHSTALPPAQIEGSAVIYRFTGLLRARVLKQLVSDDLQDMAPLIEGLLKENARGTATLAIDHMMLYGNDVSANGCTAVLVCTNDHGAPVGVTGCATKSVAAAAPWIKQHVDRSNPEGLPSVRVIFSDQPGSDQASIQAACGSQIQLLDDVWHIQQDIYDCVEKYSEQREHWEDAVNAAFQHVNEDDLKAEIERRCQGLNDAERAEMRLHHMRPRGIRSLSHTNAKGSGQLASSSRNFAGSSISDCKVPFERLFLRHPKVGWTRSFC